MEWSLVAFPEGQTYWKWPKFSPDFVLWGGGGCGLTLSQVATLKKIKYLKSRRKKKVHKIRFLLLITPSSVLNWLCKISIFTTESFFGLLYSFDINFYQGWWMITKFGRFIGDTCGDVTERFILPQSCLTSNQWVWHSKNGYFVCAFMVLSKTLQTLDHEFFIQFLLYIKRYASVLLKCEFDLSKPFASN